MKKEILLVLGAFICFVTFSSGQDIPQSEVPSLIVNSFQQTFSKAYDVEWELDADRYKVEFETGYGTDHDVWYDKTGKQIRHIEEISNSDLPQSVLNKIGTDFNGYRAGDIKKISEDGKTAYTLELRSLTEEWKVAMDSGGNILSKVAD